MISVNGSGMLISGEEYETLHKTMEEWNEKFGKKFMIKISGFVIDFNISNDPDI